VKVPCCSRSCNRWWRLIFATAAGGKAKLEDEPEARRPCHRIVFSVISDLEIGKTLNCYSMNL